MYAMLTRLRAFNRWIPPRRYAHSLHIARILAHNGSRVDVVFGEHGELQLVTHAAPHGAGVCLANA